MTNETRNIDLVIRGKNQSKKTISDVRKDIEALNEAIDQQVDASKRGEGSIKNLNTAYAALEKAMKALVDQQSVVQQFQAQSAQLEVLQQRLGQVSTKLRDHEAAMAATEKVTKRQVQTQASLTKAFTRAETAVDKQAERLANVREQGEALGLDLNNLVGTQDKLLSVGRELVATNNSLSQATENYGTNVRIAQKAAKDLADTQAFDKQAAEAAKLNKASEYTRFWVTELNKLEAAEKELAATTAFEQQAAAAAKQVQSAEYTRFWITELEKLDATERQLADNTALNKMADDAVAASRGFTTLANSTKRLVQNARPASAAIQSILDPTAQVRSTLGGVEESINAMATAIAGINGPVKDYKAQVAGLAAAQKQLTSQAASIDAFRNQVATVNEARAAFVTARAELLNYAAATRNAGTPTAEMAANQKRLETALGLASAALQTQLGRARELRAGLQQAGVATNDLAGAEARLAGAARTNVNALNDLTAAQQKHGDATNKSAEAENFFESNGRTTLSFVQRMRGEVLALVAAYVGLQGALDLATKSLDAYQSRQAIQNQLTLSVGNDPAKVAEEYNYIAGQAERIGVSFEAAAKGYAKFSAAAAQSGRNAKEIRYIFESFTEVGRVANLTTDDMNGVFLALEQIISKGKIQAEELRGQLGERLFAAFEIAAKALKDQFPNLDKAMQNGEITANQLVKIAEQYKKTVADQLPAAMQSLTANQERLNNAFFDFKLLIADAGFADAYGKLVTQITAFFRSSDGVEFANNIGAAFVKIAEVLGYLLAHLDEIKLAVELAFGLKAASLVAGFATSIVTGTKAILTLNAAVAAGTVKVGLLQKAFLGLAAFFTGWEIGTYLSDQFEVVRQVGVALVIGLEKAFTELKFAVDVVWTSISGNAQNAFNQVIGYVTDMSDSVLGVLAGLADKVGKDELGAKIRSGISDGSRAGLTDVSAEVDKLKSQLDKDLKQIDEIGEQMFADASDAAKKAREASQKGNAVTPGTPTGVPVIDNTVDTSKEDEKRRKAYEKLVKQREALAAQLVDTLAAAETKIGNNEKLSLDARLKAIDTEYAKVFTKIDKLATLPGGKDQADQMRATLTNYVAQLKVQETLKFNQEAMARNDKAINDQIALRQQLITTIKAQQDAGLITEQQAKEKIAAIDSAQVPVIKQLATDQIAWAQAHKEVFADSTAMDTYISKLTAIRDGTIATKNELLSAAQANEMLATGGVNAFDQFAKSIADGQSAIGAFRDAFLTFAADFLKQIALMILKQIILNALQNSSIGGAIAGGVNAAVKHGGGTIGSGGGRTRNVSNTVFNNAPKYHTGGVMGLAADEYPAILQRNEEVLTGDDPRNVLNGGGAQTPAATAAQNIKIINQVDSVSVLDAALNTAQGEKLILNVLRGNRTVVKQLANA